MDVSLLLALALLRELAPADFIKEMYLLPQLETLFLSSCSGCNQFKGSPNTPVIAL